MVGLNDGGLKFEDRVLTVGNGLDMETKSPLTFCFMKCVSQSKKYISRNSRILDCSFKRVFNRSLWRIFGQNGLSISGTCTGVMTAANGPGLRWSGLLEELSAVAISARSAEGRSEIPATHGYTPFLRRWVYLLERGWRKMKVKVLQLRTS